MIAGTDGQDHKVIAVLSTFLALRALQDILREKSVRNLWRSLKRGIITIL